jgi:hypothetical protein
MFTTECLNVKHISITNIYNHYLITNYLQKILKCRAERLAFGRSRIYKIKAVESKGPREILELPIKIMECFIKANIWKQSKSLHDN